MPAPDWCPVLISPLSICFVLPPDVLLAYAGLGPAQQLIPYFLALLTFAGAALIAVVQWPLSAILRRLTRFRNGDTKEPQNGPVAADVSESSGEGSHHKP